MMPPTTPTDPTISMLHHVIASIDHELDALRDLAEEASRDKQMIANELNQSYMALTNPRIQCLSADPMEKYNDSIEFLKEPMSFAEKIVNIRPLSPKHNKRNYYDMQKGNNISNMNTGTIQYELNKKYPNASFLLSSRAISKIKQREVAAYVRKKKMMNTSIAKNFAEEYVIKYNQWKERDDELDKMQRHMSTNFKGDTKVDIYGKRKEKNKLSSNKLATSMVSPYKNITVTGKTVDFESGATLIDDPFQYEEDYNKSVRWSLCEIKEFLINFMSYPKDFISISERMANKTYIELVEFFHTFKYHFKLKHYRIKYFLKAKKNGFAKWVSKVESVYV